MAQLANVKNVSRTVSNLFPRINRTHFIESSLEHTWLDVYLPIYNVDTDHFCEFRSFVNKKLQSGAQFLETPGKK